ncbi:MAG: DUF6247 family protein [Pseudonocardiaceae bacterium]
MSVLWSFDEQPRTGDPLLPGAASAVIRDVLLPEDRVRFDAAYQHALAAAREDLDLTELFRCLEHWRRVRASTLVRWTVDQTGAAGSASFSQVPTISASANPAMNIGM